MTAYGVIVKPVEQIRLFGRDLLAISKQADGKTVTKTLLIHKFEGFKMSAVRAVPPSELPEGSISAYLMEARVAKPRASIVELDRSDEC